MNPVSHSHGTPDLSKTNVEGTLAQSPTRDDDFPTLGGDEPSRADTPAPGGEFGTLAGPDPVSSGGAPSSATASPPPVNLPPELSELPDYQVIKELGRGGMGVVYQAKQKSLGRTVALKMIIGNPDSRAIDRFMNEAQAAAALNHPGMVPIFEIGQVGGKPYFTMAYIEGGSLSGLLKSGGALPPKRAVQIVLQVAQAVAHAHQANIIHRDLKPDNVLLDKQGNARVTDFGLAKQLEGNANLTATGEVLGTPTYMAPEQARGGTKSAGPGVDIYALGGLLYACLVGRAPFTGNTTIEVILKVTIETPASPRSINPDIPAELDAVCMKCLEKEPENRYPSAAALAEDLEAWLNSVGGVTTMSGIKLTPTKLSLGGATQPTASGTGSRTLELGPTRLAPAPVSAPEPVAPKRRSMAPLVGGAVLAGLLLAGVGWMFLPKNDPTKTPGTSEVAKASNAEPVGLSDQPISTDFGVTVEMLGSEKTAQGMYYLNETQKPVFRIKSDHDAYIYLISQDPKGDWSQLFPNEYDQDNHIVAGVPLTIPGTKGDNYFTMSVSEGDEKLRVIASIKPVEFPKGEKAGPFQLYASANNKARFAEVHRGIGIRPKDAPKDTPVASEAIIPYRIRRNPRRRRGQSPVPPSRGNDGPDRRSSFFGPGQSAY